MTLLSEHRGTIPISYRMFVIEPPFVEEPDVVDTLYGAGMLRAYPSSLGVRSAVYSYPTLSMLRVEMHDSRPQVEDLTTWDAAAEISYEFHETVSPRETLNVDPGPLDNDLDNALIPAGQYRVRAYARKVGNERRERPQSHIDRDPEFDDNDELVTADNLEDIVIQLWPEPFDTTNIPQSDLLKDHEEFTE